MARLTLPLILLAVLAVHFYFAEPTEPFFNGDETRHVMTGIFVADALAEGGYLHPRQYAERYYAQYPALGLIVWPPGFYAVEGVTMLAFGRTFTVARCLELAYLLLACVMLYRLAKLTHGVATAAIATLIFAFTREVFFHSRNVMLEVPTVAFVLMAMLHLEHFLRTDKKRDLVLCGLGCVLAGLHRYDAVMLVLVFALRLTFARRWRPVLRRSVIITGLAVTVALAPVYGLAAYEIGGVQASSASQGSDPTVTKPGLINQATYLIRTLWAQIGQAACVAAAIGLLRSFRSENHERSAPYWSLILATFLFFAAMAEQETRHGIFWIAGWSVLAADATLAVGRRVTWSPFVWLLTVVVLGGTAFWTLHQPTPWVRGYSLAASYALKEIPDNGIILFDGHFSGTMTYELRTQDSERRRWLVRADKVFYSALSDPTHGYVEWTGDDAAILKRLHEIAPDLIFVEEPRARIDNPMAKRLRKLLTTSDSGYVPVRTFEVANNNLDWMDGVKLIAYKPLKPRPPGERRIEIPMLWQGGKLDAVIPRK